MTIMTKNLKIVINKIWRLIMAPRALSQEEKNIVRNHILSKGKELIYSFGIKKISVDDIAKAAGIAKGSFYNYFENKEAFLFAFLEETHKEVFSRLETLLLEPSEVKDKREMLEKFIIEFFSIKEYQFLIENHEDLEYLISYKAGVAKQDFEKMEIQMFEHLISLAGFDTDIVKPGVVHNYIHAMYFMYYSDLMVKEALEETLKVQLKGIMDYIFGGEV